MERKIGMKNTRKRTILTVVLAVSLLFSIGIYAGADENKLSKDEISQIIDTQTDKAKVISPIIEIAEKARESVVGVNNYQTSRADFYGYGYGYFNTPKQSSERLVATGSGVVVSKYGHIITNHHVVNEADRVSVSFDGKEYPAEVVASDATVDIAVLLAPDIDLPPAPLGDSDQLQIGEYAIVIGNPLGEQFERTVTVGFVSALGRTVTDHVSDRFGRRSTVENHMIQVDAAINQGNSGGGMFNTLGQLQGIPARKYDNAGNPFNGFLGMQQASIDNIGMCIPINVAKPILENVLKNYDAAEVAKTNKDQTPPPKLGVTVTTLSASMNQKLDGTLPNGAYVMKVEEDSPASKGGIQKGDIIVEIDDTVINNSEQLVETLNTYKEGSEVNIKVFRTKGTDDVSKLNSIGEGEYIDLKVTLRIIGNIDM
jgi:serine protease Do